MTEEKDWLEPFIKDLVKALKQEDGYKIVGNKCMRRIVKED